jgi:hypothetical protein
MLPELQCARHILEKLFRALSGVPAPKGGETSPDKLALLPKQAEHGEAVQEQLRQQLEATRVRLGHMEAAAMQRAAELAAKSAAVAGLQQVTNPSKLGPSRLLNHTVSARANHLVQPLNVPGVSVNMAVQ